MVWNPLDPSLARDPYPRYKELRDADPVYFEEAFGWYFVTGHAEAEQVLREPDGEMRFVEFQRKRMGRDVSDEPYCRGIRSFLPAVAGEDHKRVRGTFHKHFTPKRVRAMRDEIAATAHALLDEIEPLGAADLHERFSIPLPMSSISDLLAIPSDEQPEIQEKVRHFKLAIQFAPMDDDALAKANRSVGGLMEQFADILARRRRDPGDDLLSMLIREADEGALSEEELVANAWGLFAGGFETSAAGISVGVVRLLENPDQLEALRRDPSLMPDAVDELLRLAGPVQAQHRVFDRELEVGGHTIPPDTPIIMYLVGANHDERYVERAESLDVTREPPRDHLAFGGGRHKCVGRHLAHTTIEVALGAVITRLRGLRLAGEVEWDTENMPSGSPSTVPIAWEAGERE